MKIASQREFSKSLPENPPWRKIEIVSYRETAQHIDERYINN